MSTNHNETAHNSDPFSWLDLWKSFKEIWWVSAVFAVVLAVATIIIGAVTYKPMYRSSVRFTITPLVDSNSSSGASVYNFNYNEVLSVQMAATFPHILNDGFLDEMVVHDIGRPINGKITANAIPDTNIFEMHVSSSSAKDAYDVINSLMNNYPKIAEHVVGDTRMNVLVGSEPVLSKKPYNAGYYYDYAVIAAILGVLLGCLVAFVRMYTRKNVMSKHDIETVFNGKCICEVPHVVSKRTTGGSSQALLKSTPSMSGFSESIRVLKQRVRSVAAKENMKVIGITGAIDGEGKTTLSYNLARSLSSHHTKVLLVDMDLLSHAVQTSLNRKGQVPNTGITEVVSGKLSLAESINSVSDSFDVLFAGSETVKFLKSRFAEVFRVLREQYDYIIVDMPSCMTSSESVSIADLCDGVLFTIKWNSTNQQRILSSINDLAFSDTPIIGYILNDVSINYSEYGGYKYYGKYGKRRYGYGYGYGYRYGYGYASRYGSSYGSNSEKSKSESSDSVTNS